MNTLESIIFFFLLMAILLIMNNYMIKDDGTFEMFKKIGIKKVNLNC